MAIKRFDATAASSKAFEDLNAFVVCLAELADGSGQRLELQRSLSFNNQDHQNRMDTYCVSTESGATHYGGIRSWSLTKAVLRLNLDETASKVFDVSSFEVELRVRPEIIEEVSMGLRRVLFDAG